MFRKHLKQMMYFIPTVLILWSVTTVGAEPLLRGASGIVIPKIAEKLRIPSKALLRSRALKIRLNTLRAKAKPLAFATSQERRLVLNLFDNLSVTAIADRVKRGKGTDFNWAGSIKGKQPGQAVLIVRKNKLYANVRIGTKLYQIRPAGAGKQFISEIDTAKLPDEGSDHLIVKVAPSQDAGSDSDVGLHHGSHVNELINVMVVYTPAAKAEAQNAGIDIEAEIELAIEEANQAYINSGISQRLVLAYTGKVNYTESGKSKTDLKALRNKSDKKMDGVHAIRNQVYADIVTLLYKKGGSRGYFMGNVSTKFESSAFNVVDRGAIPGFTFIHELGHNMGAHHDRDASDISNRGKANKYYYGYVKVGKWKTIMSYNTICAAQKKPCGRIQFFSNPKKTYQGDKMGIAAPSKNSADNARRLNKTSETVARFRTLGKNEKGDLFGRVVASGDFNGDGLTDLAVGAPKEDVGIIANSGAVFIYRGTEFGLAPWKVLTQKGLGSNEIGDQFGFSLAAGDFNGDGKDDLAVGAPYEKPGTKPKSGWVFVFKGTTQGPKPWKAFGQKGIGSDEKDDRFGFSLAAGDFNGDGKDDLAVGAPFEKPGKKGKRSGWVYVFKGGSQGPKAWKGFGQKGLGKNEKGDWFGYSLAAGDFNGDGKDDLAVGAPGEKVGTKLKSGWVFVFKGGSQGPKAWKGFGQKGLGKNEKGDQFGRSLAAGDFNGDGKDDLAVGAPFEKPGKKGKRSGWVYVFKGGSQGPKPWSSFGQKGLGKNEEGDQFGRSLAAGDFNGDGRADLVVGAPGEKPGKDPKSGYVYAFKGLKKLTRWHGITQER
jgi:hypothetical protein